MSSEAADSSFNSSVSADEGFNGPHRRNVRPLNLTTDGDSSFDMPHTHPSTENIFRNPGPDDDRYILLFGNLSFHAFSAFTQRLVAHPCLVFRNQCQLNTRVDTSYRLMPWSMLRPLHSIYKNQELLKLSMVSDSSMLIRSGISFYSYLGALALWKGVHNDMMISFLTTALEMVISENSSLPMTLDVPSKSNVISTYGKHLLLKTISTLAATPFICAGHMLRVQSQVVVGDTNYLALFPEAYSRVVSSIYSHSSETSHMLPLYKLVAPITVLSLGSYIIHSMSMGAIQRQYQQNTLHLQDNDHDEVPLIKTMYDRYYPQLLGAFCGRCMADIFFYPLSTITGRLILQGTRTIIDDVETGNAVLPFTSSYTGVVNCMQTIISEEGVSGLYKGLGALIMQYTVQALILRGTHLLYERVMDTHYPRVPRQNIYAPPTPSSTYSSVTSLNMKS